MFTKKVDHAIWPCGYLCEPKKEQQIKNENQLIGMLMQIILGTLDKLEAVAAVLLDYKVC